MLRKARLNKVMGMTGKPNKLVMFLLLMSVSILLSGCLVDKKKPEDVVKISRTTDTLRIYQAGDFVDYYVTAVINTQASTTVRYGTLRIQWDNTADLTDPITPTETYSVLKETTTLTYDGSTQPDAIVTRYISQVTTAPINPSEPGIGSIILHAIDDPADDKDYWPYPDGTTPSTSPVIRPIIIKSPLVVSSTFPASYSIMECNNGLCANEIYNFTDTNFTVVGDTQEVTTDLGIFSNPFELSFLGVTVPAVGAPAVSFLGDIRDACGTSADRITHSDNMFVMPEIGMVKMNNTCTNITSGESVIYNIRARDTNITF